MEPGSRGAEALLGHGAAAVIERPFAELLDPGVPSRVTERILGEFHVVAQVTMLRRDDRPVDVELMAHSVGEDGGEPARLLAAAALPNQRNIASDLLEPAFDQAPSWLPSSTPTCATST